MRKNVKLKKDNNQLNRINIILCASLKFLKVGINFLEKFVTMQVCHYRGVKATPQQKIVSLVDQVVRF